MSKNIESEQLKKKGNRVPIRCSGMGTRITDTSKGVGGKKKLAELTLISESQLHRIISGESQAKIEQVAAIASIGNVTIDWLATVEGDKHPGEHQVADDRVEYGAKDRDSYLQALQLIEEVLQGANVDIKPHKKVDLVKLVATMIEQNDTESIKPQLLQLVKLAA